MSSGLFVQIIIWNNIFLKNKSQVHLSSFSRFTFLENLQDVLLGNTERSYDLSAFSFSQTPTGMPQPLNWHHTEYSTCSGHGEVNSQLCSVFPLWCRDVMKCFRGIFQVAPRSDLHQCVQGPAGIMWGDHLPPLRPHSLLLIRRASDWCVAWANIPTCGNVCTNTL